MVNDKEKYITDVEIFTTKKCYTIPSSDEDHKQMREFLPILNFSWLVVLFFRYTSVGGKGSVKSSVSSV